MKKGIYAILTALSVIALVMTGCPDGSEDGGGGGGDGVNTRLSRIDIAGGSKQFGNNDHSETLAGVTGNKLFAVNVSKLDADDADVKLTMGSQFKFGEVKIARIGADKTPTEADFKTTWNANTDKLTWELEYGDKIYVKMIAPKGNAAYYGVQVFLGDDATLKEEGIVFKKGTIDIPIDRLGKAVTAADDAAAKTALDALDEDDAGKLQFPETQPLNGFDSVKFVPNDRDPDVEVTYSLTGDTYAAAPTGVFKLEEGQNLYVKVVSASKEKTNYYKIILVLKRVYFFKYATVTDLEIADDGTNADPAWNNVSDWSMIDRANDSEGGGWKAQLEKDRSHGRVKLLWDEDGIWVYAQVWEKVVSTSPNEHSSSSVEVFVNEAYSEGVRTGSVTGSDPNGGQYRLGANKDISGAPTAAVSLFRSLEKYNAKKITTMPASPWGDKTDITGGYVLVFQVPWRYPDQYPIVKDKPIGLELQINATGSSGSRVGVLNWNNTSSNSYISLADFGEAVLTLEAGQSIGAMKPFISAQPVGGKVNINATTLPKLSVTASSLDNGTLGYQWYKADSAEGDGTEISGATTKEYQLTTSDIDVATAGGRYYFYVIVSNTRTGAPAAKYVTSDRVLIRVVDPAAPPTTIELIDSSIPGYDPGRGGVVKGPVGSYGTILTLPVDELAGYDRVEIVFDAFESADASGTAVTQGSEITANAIRLQITGNGGVDLGNFGSNATGVITGGYSYTLTDAQKAGNFGAPNSGLVLENKGSASDPAIQSYVIKSVKIIPAATP